MVIYIHALIICYCLWILINCWTCNVKSVCKAAAVSIREFCDSSFVCVMHYELASQTSQQSPVFSLLKSVVNSQWIAAKATAAYLVIADGFAMLCDLCHSYIISLYGHFTASVGLS